MNTCSRSNRVEVVMADLPDCLCGFNNWSGNGGHFGGLNQQNYRCSVCGRVAALLSSWGGNLFMVVRSIGSNISTNVSDWFDGVVQPLWRANSEPDSPKYGERVPIPPQIPGDEIQVWLNRVDGDSRSWESIDADMTQDLPLPADPIRVNHDAVFGEIFSSVGITRWKEIPNRYYKDKFNKQPWYEIVTGDHIITIGPRKRVINIEMVRQDGMDLVEGALTAQDTIERLGKSDSTTHEVGSRRIMIHAWGKEKAIEYLGLMLSATPVLDRMSSIK